MDKMLVNDQNNSFGTFKSRNTAMCSDLSNSTTSKEPTDFKRRSAIVFPGVSNDMASKELKFMIKISSALPVKPTCLMAPLQNQPKAANGVPIVIEACLRYFSMSALDCQGLFRVPGNVRRVDEMWAHMERHPCARLSVNGISMFMLKHPEYTPYDAASFLKRFIGSVCREPVVTYMCYQPLLELIQQQVPAHLIGEKYKRIIGQLLVPDHRALLGRLCTFILEFSLRVEETFMNVPALAVCFGFLVRAPPMPNTQDSPRRRRLLCGRNRRSPSNEQLQQELLVQAKIAKLNVLIIETMIRNAQHIFLDQYN